MNRLGLLNRARALAQQQCDDSSCLTEKEFADIKKLIVTKESSEEVELYRKVLEILKAAVYDMDAIFMEVSRSFQEDEND